LTTSIPASHWSARGRPGAPRVRLLFRVGCSSALLLLALLNWAHAASRVFLGAAAPRRIPVSSVTACCASRLASRPTRTRAGACYRSPGEMRFTRAALCVGRDVLAALALVVAGCQRAWGHPAALCSVPGSTGASFSMHHLHRLIIIRSPAGRHGRADDGAPCFRRAHPTSPRAGRAASAHAASAHPASPH